METVVDQTAEIQKDNETNIKRPGFFQRLRRSFTLIFRRRNNRKRNKSDSQVQENNDLVNNHDKNGNLSSSLTNEQLTDIKDDAIKPTDAKPAKVPLFVNDFTSELKQSLKLRSRKIEEGEKSPTKVIEEIENLRSLSCAAEEEKCDVKIEIESKTFEEKLALFESQISGGSGSVHDTIKRDKSGQIDSVDGDVGENGNVCDGEVVVGDVYECDYEDGKKLVNDEGMDGGIHAYSIDVVKNEVEEVVGGDEESVHDIVVEDITIRGSEDGCAYDNTDPDQKEDHVDIMDVSGFVNQLIEEAAQTVCALPDTDKYHEDRSLADVQ